MLGVSPAFYFVCPVSEWRLHEGRTGLPILLSVQYPEKHLDLRNCMMYGRWMSEFLQSAKTALQRKVYFSVSGDMLPLPCHISEILWLPPRYLFPQGSCSWITTWSSPPSVLNWIFILLFLRRAALLHLRRRRVPSPSLLWKQWVKTPALIPHRHTCDGREALSCLHLSTTCVTQGGALVLGLVRSVPLLNPSRLYHFHEGRQLLTPLSPNTFICKVEIIILPLQGDCGDQTEYIKQCAWQALPLAVIIITMNTTTTIVTSYPLSSESPNILRDSHSNPAYKCSSFHWD